MKKYLKTNYPKVSVVIPSYNQGLFIESTIISIINQNYKNIELIIIDACSTDSTVQILNKYNDFITYWVSERDNGQSDAIKKGFNIATGEIFAWLNSDDKYYSENTISEIVDFFLKTKADVVYGNMYIMDIDENIVAKRYLTTFLPAFIRKSYFCGGFGIYQPSTFWRSDLYRNVDGVESNFRFCMDNDLFNKFVQFGAKFLFIDKFISVFRVHDLSKTSNLSIVAIKERSELFSKYVMDNKIKYPSILILFARIYKIICLIFALRIIQVIKFRYFDKYKWVP